MKLTYRITSVICALVILTSIICIPVAVNAVSGSNSKVKWSINKNGVLSVSRKASSGKTTIPDYSLSNKAPWNKYASSIKSVVINSNITRIGSYSFWGLNKATKITIGKHVTEMGIAPFGHCESLKSFAVTSSSTSKAYKTSNGILYNYKKTLLVAYPQNKSGSTFTCPSSVTEIKAFAFNLNQNLTKFTHNSPGSIKSINDNAFSSSKKLKNVTIKNNCKNIGKKAFYNITTLETVTIPPSVTSVGSELFLSSSKVKSLRIHCSPGSKIYNYLKGKGYIITPKSWTFKCKFNANGGDCDEESKTVTFNEKYGDLPEAEKEGYDFVGWYNNDKKVISSTIVYTPESHTLKAKYSAQKAELELDANGGICNTEYITVTYNQPIGELPVPVRPGYIFLGWYTSSDEEEAEQVTTDMVYDDFDIETLYALWKKPCETVTGLEIEYNTKKSVELSWDEQEEISGYEVYAKTNNNESFRLMKTVKDCSVVISLSPKYKYTFKVRSYLNMADNSIMYGEFSSEVSRAKTAVNTLRISSSYKSSSGLLKVKWKKVSNATAYQIQQYKNKKWKNVKTTTSTAFYVYTKNKNYKYRVRAYTTVLGHKYYGKYSKISAKTLKQNTYLTAPKIKISYTKNKNYAILTWKKVKGASKYQIYKIKNGKWKKFKTIKKKSYKMNIKKRHKTYKVRIRAYKKLKGKSYYSNFTEVKIRKI